MSRRAPQGILILAAGASSRMGKAKQLLSRDGVSLVRRAATEALASGLGPVGVVLGAHREMIEPELRSLPLTVVRNFLWESGPGSSLSVGIRWLQKIEPSVHGALVMLCDQPGVDADTLRRLVAAGGERGKPVVASSYAGTTGVPAWFARSLFPRLLALDPAAGAKRVIHELGDEALPMPVPEAALDIDTPEDWARYRADIESE